MNFHQFLQSIRAFPLPSEEHEEAKRKSEWNSSKRTNDKQL